MEFIEAPAFTRHLSDYLNDEDYREMQARLGANPELGDLMPGTGGFRKEVGGCAARQRPQRRAADHLLLLQVRASDMADDYLRQERSCGPDGKREEGAQGRNRNRVSSTSNQTVCWATEDAVMAKAKRDIFGELMDGVAAMKNHREGELTLRTCKVEVSPLPKVDSKLLRDTRKKLHCSRAVFARKLRINERTLEKWEQGRAKPNPQAAALVLLVRKYPDTLARLDALARA